MHEMELENQKSMTENGETLKKLNYIKLSMCNVILIIYMTWKNYAIKGKRKC